MIAVTVVARRVPGWASAGAATPARSAATATSPTERCAGVRVDDRPLGIEPPQGTTHEHRAEQGERPEGDQRVCGIPERVLERLAPLGEVDGRELHDEDDQEACDRASGDEPRGKEHPGGHLALLRLAPDPVRQPPHRATHEDRERRRDRQVGADGPGEAAHAAELHHDGERAADEDEAPGQVAREHALDDRRHERALRRGQAVGPDRAPRRIVHAHQREADDRHRHEHADDEADLLVERRRADDVAGLQVLRRRAGVGRRDADDRADRERGRLGRGLLRRVVRPPGDDEDQARAEQRRNRHPRDRVRRGSDQTDDAGRDRDEEEAEHDDEQADEERPRKAHRHLLHERDEHRHRDRSERHVGDGDVALGAGLAGAAHARAELAERVADGGVDRRQRPEQRHEAGHRHGAGADVADVGAVDPVGLAVGGHPRVV